MSARLMHRLPLALCLVALPALSAASASAQATDPAATTPPTTPAREVPPFTVAVEEGLAKLREGNAVGAQLAFQRAVSIDGSKPEAHYYLGVAMRRHGSMPHAVESFRHAVARAQQASDLAWEGRARFAVAETLAAMDHHHAHAAQQAFAELTAFAEANPTSVPPETVRALAAAHTRMAEVTAAAEPVRDRIRSREREAGRGR